MTRTSFTFLVHPRTRTGEDLARVWRPLGRVPEKVYDTALRRLPLPPVTIAAVEVGGEQVGHVVLVPFGARHLLEAPAEGRARVARAVDRAVALGSGVVGLGALTATVTAGGASLRSRTDIAVTNGNAFTAATVERQARDALDRLVPTGGRRVAVVGATGSVGTAVTRLLARDGGVDHLVLVSRTAPRLAGLAAEVGARVPTTTATDLRAVADADLVILLTASADAVLRAEHLAPGAVVLDATQPRNTSPSSSSSGPTSSSSTAASSTSPRCGCTAATSACPTVAPTPASPRPRCSRCRGSGGTSRSATRGSTSSTAPAAWRPTSRTSASCRPRRRPSGDPSRSPVRSRPGWRHDARRPPRRWLRHAPRLRRPGPGAAP